MKAKLLKGFKDYGPQEMSPRRTMITTIEEVFLSFGYGALSTPALEYAEILAGKYGEEGDKLMYRFLDNGEREVALRYDLTVPLARYLGTNPNLKMPFRRYAIAPVWRAERPQKGRFREFMQCDADLVGSDSALADAEIIMIGCSLMTRLGLEDFQIRLSHRGVLDGLMESLAIPQKDRISVIRTLDKARKISEDELKAGFLAVGMDQEQLAGLLKFLEITGTNQERLDLAEAITGATEPGRAAVERLREVVDLCTRAGFGHRVLIDTTIARGLDYYTGAVYETFLENTPEFGSVMSGGRYDRMLGDVAGRDLPAIGISVGLDRLFAALLDRGQLTTPAGVSQVMVCSFPETADLAFSISTALRSRLVGTSLELYPTPVRLKKQLQYANDSGVKILVIPGPDEVEKGQITIRNMASGQQETLAKDALESMVDLIRSWL